MTQLERIQAVLPKVQAMKQERDILLDKLTAVRDAVKKIRLIPTLSDFRNFLVTIKAIIKED